MTIDFNAEKFEPYPGWLICQHDLTIVTKDGTCLKYLVQPSCTGLALRNSAPSIQYTSILLVGLKDFQKLAVSNLKTTLVKCKPSEMFCWNFKTFDSIDTWTIYATSDHHLFQIYFYKYSK